MPRTRLAAAVCFTLAVVSLAGKQWLSPPWSSPFAVLQPVALLTGILLLLREQPVPRRTIILALHYLLLGLLLIPIAVIIASLWAGAYISIPGAVVGLLTLAGASIVIKRLALRQ